MNKRIIVITIVSWILFFIEAIMSFSVGKIKEGETFRIILPNKNELIKLSVILLLFSILNGFTTNLLVKLFK